MKIMLLFPRWTAEYGIFSHFARRASTWHPLNLAYLAAIALRLGHTVKIIDGECENMPIGEMIKQTCFFAPDIIGITATTPFYHIAEKLAEGLKDACGKTPVIIGGPHITILKEAAFSRFFDYGFIGESEKSWPSFLDCFESGGDISAIKGLLYRKNGNAVFTGEAEPIEQIDSIPFPARNLLKLDKYRIGTMRGRKVFATIMASRGCPFECIFCSTKVFGTRVRERAAQSVIEEIKSIVSDYGIRHFIFLDDTLTLSRQYILQICLMIKKEKLRITFEGNTRADLVDEELVSVMAKSGLVRISFGLETVNPGIRKVIKKNVALEAYSRANKLTNKYGIETLNSVMLGLPGETYETVEETLSFLENAREVRQANFSIATPYPGTELYEMAKNGEHGLKLLTGDFSKYRRYGSAVMSVNELSIRELIRLQNDGFVRIYSAPWRMIPMLKKSGFFGGLLMLLRLAKKVLKIPPVIK